MNLRFACLAFMFAGAAASAWAQTPAAAAASTPVVDARQQRQNARINQGVASGELTHREARRLRGEQRVIDKAEASAKADGVVTTRERAKLQHMQNDASRDIRHQKHDRQHRPASAP